MPGSGNLLQHIFFIYLFIIKKSTIEISPTNIYIYIYIFFKKPLLCLLNHTSNNSSKEICSSRLGLQEMRIRFIYIFLKRAWTRYCLDYFVNQDTKGTFAKKKKKKKLVLIKSNHSLKLKEKKKIQSDIYDNPKTNTLLYYKSHGSL